MTASTQVEDHPDRLGSYAIEGVLGRGAFGIVYLARNGDETCALKVLRRENLSPFTIERLRAEEAALRLLAEDDPQHTFPRVLGTGRFDDTPYLAMEHVAGGPIDSFCAGHGLDLDARLRLFTRVCGAVQKAHRAGILHRDLKPAHILVAWPSPHEEPSPRIIDLGLARGEMFSLVLGQTTAPGIAMGAPGFVSPEQAAGGRVDVRTDVYSLGVVLYLLVSGCMPVDSDPAATTALRPDPDQLLPRPDRRFAELARRAPAEAEAIAACRGATPEALERDLATDLAWIVMKAVDPDRRRRYQDPAELAEDLRRYQQKLPVTARPWSWRYRAGLWLKRHRVGAVVAAAALVVAAGFVWLTQENLAQARANELLANEQAMLKQRANAERLFAAGRSLHARGSHAEAVKNFDMAAELGFDDRLELGIRRVAALEAANRIDEARTVLAELSSRPDAQQRRAELLFLHADLGVPRLDTPDLHLDEFREALAIDARTPGSLTKAEAAYSRAMVAETPREALAELRSALAADPGHLRSNQCFALTLLLLGEIEEANLHAPTLIALFPDAFEQALFCLGVAALRNDQRQVEHCLRKIETHFAKADFELAQLVVDGMEVKTWGNRMLVGIVREARLEPATVIASITAVYGRAAKLLQEMEERTQQHGWGGTFFRAPSSLARLYRGLLVAADKNQKKPMRPETFAPLATVEPGQADAVLIYLDAGWRWIRGEHAAAFERMREALAGRSCIVDREVMLYAAMSIAAAEIVVLRKDPTAAAHVADCTRSLQTWFAEARRAPDPTPDLLRIWNGIAALLGDSGAFVETGIAWSHQAPDDPKARFAVFEALLQLDAAEPAAAMLQALEADATIVERGLIDASLLRRGRPELESYRANGRKPVEASGAKNGGK